MNFPRSLRLGKFSAHLLSLLFLTSATAGISYSQAVEANASNCTIGKRAAKTGFWTWEPGSHVRVFVLQDDFSAAEIPFLTRPLQLWDAVWETTGSKVRMTYAGTTLKPLACDNCLTIVRSKIFNGKTRHGGEVKAFGIPGTNIIKYATIAIDPKLTNPETVSHAVAHEIGHSFGLLDCYDCMRGSTVMRHFKNGIFSNNIEGPTPCDVVQVRTAYEEVKRRVRPAVVAAVSEDEGEEPVPDDTPLVVPQP